MEIKYKTKYVVTIDSICIHMHTHLLITLSGLYKSDNLHSSLLRGTKPADTQAYAHPSVFATSLQVTSIGLLRLLRGRALCQLRV